MGTSRIKKERARSNRPLVEYLLPPDKLLQLMDKRAREAPGQEAFLRDELPLRDRLDVGLLVSLPPYDRLVVLGTYWGGMSQRMIARETHSSQTRVRLSLRRSLISLRVLCPSRSTAAGAVCAEGT